MAELEIGIYSEIGFSDAAQFSGPFEWWKACGSTYHRTSSLPATASAALQFGIAYYANATCTVIKKVSGFPGGRIKKRP